MRSTKTFFFLITPLAACVAILVTWYSAGPSTKVMLKSEQVCGDKETPLSLPDRSTSAKVYQSDTVTQNKKQKTSGEFVSELRDLSKRMEGRILREAQNELVQRAKENLKGMEMAKFIEQAHAILGGEVRRYAIGSSIHVLFDCKQDERHEVFEWALNLTDVGLQSELLPSIGMFMQGLLEEKDFLAVIPQLGKQQALDLLEGYCRSQAASDGPKAVATYISLKPEGADFSGLPPVMRSLGEKTDFAAVDKLLPDDSKPIARESRTAMMKRWAEIHPKAALEYVLASNGKVSIGQMDVVLSTWAESQREAAETWVREQTDTKIRSHGAHAMATHMENDFPDHAWSWALEIQDAAQRDRKLKEVHAIWLKRDPVAAERARLSIGN